MKRLQARDVLFSEGDTDGKLFIIHKGSFIVQRKEGAKLRSGETFQSHSVVGKGSLLNFAPHRYTLRAMESSEVEEISQDDLASAFQSLPVWFSPFLRFMESRLETAKRNKSTLDKIHAIPTALFVCAKFARHLKEAIFDLDKVASDIRAINGLAYSETLDLFQGFCELGISEIIPGECPRIRFYRKNLPRLLYRTLIARMAGKSLPRSILSANDQTILTAFISAAKTRGHENEDRIFILAKDFIATYGKLFPGIKITRRAFTNLVQCGYLFSSPEFSSDIELDTIKEFYGDREAIKDLLELNRVYPMLDRRLPQAISHAADKIRT